MVAPWAPGQTVTDRGEKWLKPAATAPTIHVTVKQYDGSAWISRVAVPKVWRGTGWQVAQPKRWTGSAWVNLP